MFHGGLPSIYGFRVSRWLFTRRNVTARSLEWRKGRTERWHEGVDKFSISLSPEWTFKTVLTWDWKDMFHDNKRHGRRGFSFLDSSVRTPPPYEYWTGEPGWVSFQNVKQAGSQLPWILSSSWHHAWYTSIQLSKWHQMAFDARLSGYGGLWIWYDIGSLTKWNGIQIKQARLNHGIWRNVTSYLVRASGNAVNPNRPCCRCHQHQWGGTST